MKRLKFKTGTLSTEKKKKKTTCTKHLLDRLIIHNHEKSRFNTQKYTQKNTPNDGGMHSPLKIHTALASAKE